MQDNGTLILVRKNTFTNVQISRRVTSDDGNAATLLTCQLDGVPLILVNSHFDTDSPTRREQQAKLIENLFQEAIQNSKLYTNGNFTRNPLKTSNGKRTNGHVVGNNTAHRDPILIWAGDFNMEKDNDLIQSIFSHGWRDLLQEKEASYPTLCSARKTPQRIDFILGKGNVVVKDASVPAIPLQNNPAEYCSWAVRKFGSDHLPVSVGISL